MYIVHLLNLFNLILVNGTSRIPFSYYTKTYVIGVFTQNISDGSFHLIVFQLQSLYVTLLLYNQ
jgi:hypothetical protein